MPLDHNMFIFESPFRGDNKKCLSISFEETLTLKPCKEPKMPLCTTKPKICFTIDRVRRIRHQLLQMVDMVGMEKETASSCIISENLKQIMNMKSDGQCLKQLEKDIDQLYNKLNKIYFEFVNMKPECGPNSVENEYFCECFPGYEEKTPGDAWTPKGCFNPSAIERTCGHPKIPNRIINGKQPPLGAYPGMAALGYRSMNFR